MTPDPAEVPACHHTPCLGHFAATGDDRCILARLTDRRNGAGEWIAAAAADPVRALCIAALVLVLLAGAIAAIF